MYGGILARWTLLLEIGELLNYILDIDKIEVLIGQGNSILREFCKSYLRVLFSVAIITDPSPDG